MYIAAAFGCIIILWTIALTARKYSKLPARMAYPKYYGDESEQHMPKMVVWLLPVVQVFVACIVGWATSLRLANAPYTHGDPLTGLIIADCVLLVLYFVQRNVMLRPDNATGVQL
jgi:hypothetical protein